LTPSGVDESWNNMRINDDSFFFNMTFCGEVKHSRGHAIQAGRH